MHRTDNSRQRQLCSTLLMASPSDCPCCRGWRTCTTGSRPWCMAISGAAAAAPAGGAVSAVTSCCWPACCKPAAHAAAELTLEHFFCLILFPSAPAARLDKIYINGHSGEIKIGDLGLAVLAPRRFAPGASCSRWRMPAWSCLLHRAALFLLCCTTSPALPALPGPCWAAPALSFGAAPHAGSFPVADGAIPSPGRRRCDAGGRPLQPVHPQRGHLCLRPAHAGAGHGAQGAGGRLQGQGRAGQGSSAWEGPALGAAACVCAALCCAALAQSIPSTSDACPKWTHPPTSASPPHPASLPFQVDRTGEADWQERLAAVADPAARAFIARCLSPVEQRPAAQDLLDDAFLQVGC